MGHNDGSSDDEPNSPLVAHECSRDPSTDATLVRQIVTAVAALENCDPLELPPLFEAVDTEALKALSPSDDVFGVELIHLRYCGYRIEVTPSTLTFRRFA